MSASVTYQYEPALDYAGGEAVIEEIEFDPKLVNSISLIGITGRDIELKHLATGHKVASVGLAVRPGKNKETEWFEVEMWGPLAERAAETVKKGSQVAVQGRIKVDNWQDKATGQTRKAYRVVANSLKRVRSWQQPVQQQEWAQQQAPPPPPQQPPQQQQQQQQWEPFPAAAAPPPPAAEPAAPDVPLTTTGELWMSYFEDPAGWFDNRTRKQSGQIKSNAPDFKRKGAGDQPALWIEGRTTPAWVKSELAKLDAPVRPLTGPPF